MAGATLLLLRVSWLRPVNIIWGPLLWLCSLLLYPIEWLGWPFRVLWRAFSPSGIVG